MIGSRTLATVALASALMIGAPGMTPPAAAQSAPSMSVSTVVPVVLWAVTGAVIGAVAWPMVAGGATAAAAAPGVMSVGSFLNMGALAGTFLGGTGYLLTR